MTRSEKEAKATIVTLCILTAMALFAVACGSPSPGVCNNVGGDCYTADNAAVAGSGSTGGSSQNPDNSSTPVVQVVPTANPVIVTNP